MLTDMDKWTRIRRDVLVGGLSRRQACKKYNLNFRTIQKVLRSSRAASIPLIPPPTTAILTAVPPWSYYPGRYLRLIVIPSAHNTLAIAAVRLTPIVTYSAFSAARATPLSIRAKTSWCSG